MHTSLASSFLVPSRTLLVTIAAVAIGASIPTRGAAAQSQRGYMTLVGARVGTIRGESASAAHPSEFEVNVVGVSPAVPGSGPATITATIGPDAAGVLISVLDRPDVLTLQMNFYHLGQNAKETRYAGLRAVNAQLTSYSFGTVAGHPLSAVVTFVAQKATTLDSAGAPSKVAVPALPFGNPTANAAPVIRGDQMATLQLGVIDPSASARGQYRGVPLDSVSWVMTHPVGAGATTISPIHFSARSDTAAVSQLQHAAAAGDSLKTTTIKWYAVDRAGVAYCMLELQLYRGLLRGPVTLAGSPGLTRAVAKGPSAGAFDVLLPPSVTAGNHVLTVTHYAVGATGSSAAATQTMATLY